MIRYPTYYDGTYYNRPEKEIDYNELMKIFYNFGLMKTLTDKVNNFDKLGEDSTLYLSYIFHIQEFVILLSNYIEDLRRAYCAGVLTESYINNLRDSLKIKCIHNTFLCRYKDSTIVNKLMEYVKKKEQEFFGSFYIDEDGFYFILENGNDCSRYKLEL